MMPAAKEGGTNYRKIMAEMSLRDGVSADKLLDAIELITTGDIPGGVKIIFDVVKEERKDMKVHTLLSAADVDEAMDIFNKEILPALKSGNK